MKVAQSRACARRVRSAVIIAGGLLPELDATAGYNRSRGSKNVQIPFSALAGGSPPAAHGSSGSSSASLSGPSLRPQDTESGTGAPATGSEAAPPGGPNSPFGEGGLPGVTTNLYWPASTLSGKWTYFRRRPACAMSGRRAQQAAAAQQGEYGVRVTLLAEVATTYMQLRLDQQREVIARRNVDSQRADLADCAESRSMRAWATPLGPHRSWRSSGSPKPHCRRLSPPNESLSTRSPFFSGRIRHRFRVRVVPDPSLPFP